MTTPTGPAEPLRPADLQAFMQQHAIAGEILFLEMPTPPVEAAARAVGASPNSIVKSILFLVDDQPVLAVACGNGLVDRRLIARRYGVGRKRVKLADPETVLRLSGYEVGAMPPFGHLQPLPTLVDPRLLEHDVVYAGGGAENALLRLHSAEILRLSGAEPMDLMETGDADRSAQ